LFNLTIVSPDLSLGPENPRIRYVGNLFQITWGQYLFGLTEFIKTPVISP